ncbi:MAG: RHS repeat-associated core domain-containing protein, partial [Gammaproteobacteria bacterium]
MLKFSRSLFFVLVLLTCRIGHAFYDAPYWYGAFGNDPSFPTIEQAVDDWWARYQVMYAYAFPGCSYTLSLDSSGPSTGYFAYVSLQGTCGGGGSINGTYYPENHRKDYGTPNQCVGNPCNPAIGNKFQQEIDLENHANGLAFIRSYNSGLGPIDGVLGYGWTHSIGSRLEIIGNQIIVHQADGRAESFNLMNGSWEGDADSVLTLTQDQNGYSLTDLNISESYDSAGQLLSRTDTNGRITNFEYDTNQRLSTVTGPFGHTLSFTYNADGRIDSMTAPGSRLYQYQYDGAGNLTKVIYPDTTFKLYHYENPNFPHALTGITDENGSRYATWAYDSQGRANLSKHAGDVEQVNLIYNSDGTTDATDSFNTVKHFVFQNILDVRKVTGISQTTIDGISISSSRSYDANGNVEFNTDFNGHTTSYSYDLTRNLEIQRVEAVGQPETRTISTVWHPYWRQPAGIAEPNKITYWVYNGDNGQYCAPQTATVPRPDGGSQLIAVLCAKVEQATEDGNGSQGFSAAAAGSPRVWSYTYDEYGRMLTADGPRTDVADITQYGYYALDDADINKRGNVSTITNALGQQTHITRYSPDGQPEEIVDPNGLVVTLGYDARRRLISIDSGGEITGYEYDPAGLLLRTTLPDNAFLSYHYDAAHRLTDVEDGQGNRISYLLDAMGNRINEDVYDPAQQLVRTRTRVYDALNRLQQDIGAAPGRIGQYHYDAVGNPTVTTLAQNRNIQHIYDALNRLISVTDPLAGETRYHYDGQDHLIGVTDPADQATTYERNGFGEIFREISPDRGTTTYTYDEAGNLKSRTDARGVTINYSYDALNRIVSVDPGDTPRTYTWDNCTLGIGRLCGLTDYVNSTAYQYDLHGRVISKTQTVAGTALSVVYQYDADGNLLSMTTPAGQTIGYTYANHRVDAVTLNGQSLLSAIGYAPFGPVSGWIWGNGQPASRGYDLDGRLTVNDSLPSLPVSLNWDEADRVESITANGQTQTFGYDALDRLDDAVGDWGSQQFSYDALGNRLSKTETAGITQYTYEPNSHRLTGETGPVNRSYWYDAAGQLLYDGTFAFVHDNSGRLLAEQLAGTPINLYIYNAQGQRVMKISANDGTQLFVYDEAGHLIGEYSANSISEYVWLGDLPVAVLKSQSNSTMGLAGYIHADHLGTPRKITDPASDQVIWQWGGAPFGETPANEDPDGDGIAFAFNLRFPGQYYDKETGKHYNYHRHYDPTLGRYIQSDPIGLSGGINTYAYV